MKPAVRCRECGRVLILLESKDSFGEISLPCARCKEWQTVDLRTAFTSASLDTHTIIAVHS